MMSNYSNGVQACYDYATAYMCDEDTAAAICDSIGGYGATTALVPADEWDSNAALRADYICLIGEDAALDYYIVGLR